MEERSQFDSLVLEVEEIETRERGRPNCTSSTTSDLCTCLCRLWPPRPPK